MKYIIGCLALFLSSIFSASFGQSKGVNPSGKAIICLTYDDGLATQLSVVLPQLDSLGLKATFFLNSISGSSASPVIGQTPEAVLGWTQAAKNGHELGNHTLFHPCPEALGWDKALAIDNYTIDKIMNEIITANALLSFLDPKRTKRSFAFPCNNVRVAGVEYAPLIRDKGLVTFGRAGGDSSSVITDFKQLNPMQVPSWHVWTGTTLEQLIAFAEKVKKTGGMGVYQLHGVGGQVFQISKETHLAFLNYLKTNEKDFWITTFSEAMEYIIKQK